MIYSRVFWPRKEADSLIIGWCHLTIIGFSEMRSQQLLTLYRRSFFGCCDKRNNHLFAYNTDQYIYCRVTWQCSPLIVECERLKLVDATLTLIFRSGKWQTAFQHSIIVRNLSHTGYWHIVLLFWVFWFAIRCFVASAFLINLHPCYVSESWRGHIAFLRFQPVIDCM
jgi:hypothetical protein